MNNADNGTAEQLLNVLCPMFTQFAAVARELQITKAASALDVPSRPSHDIWQGSRTFSASDSARGCAAVSR